ncbi:unnamed protein product [Schistosoma curassoni]|uniref:DDE_Tnp_Tn3 domain-containing protein n=1 Tax=Schistosoma curassoni TaxID=6186 RepID=A0A183JFI7_9TREM|nr:unnamed protein product [Schistosoma curassoni]
MSAYSSLLSGHAYRKLPGEERVDHCSASHVTYGGLNLHGVIEDCGRSLGFCENLKANAFPAISKKTLFAYLYGAKCIANSVFAIDGWDVYNAEEEYHRQNIFTNGWRITKVSLSIYP